ncbi:hypothetical protein [Deinococcus aluminii]|uniref:DUF2325 domain-containing protein n=1 Tax=Deinococcus aluminii TaxID=1656885 RepID=A0ABP9XFE1_9DEIO
MPQNLPRHLLTQKAATHLQQHVPMLTLPHANYTLAPKGFEDLITRTQGSLAQLERDLLGDTDAPLPLHAFYAPRDLEHTLLCGHLSVLGLRLLLTQQLPPADFHLICDLAATFGQQHPAGSAIENTLRDLARVGSTHDPVRLTPDEVQHAAAILLEQAARLRVAPPERLQEHGLAHALLRLPEVVRHPCQPALEDLRPAPTTRREARAREDDLLRHLAADPGDHAAYAALLLLHVNARDTQANMPVVLLLNQAALHLLAARDLGTPPEQVQALSRHLRDLHAELGRPRVQALRPGTVVARDAHARLLGQGLGSLRRLTVARRVPLTQHAELFEQGLWCMFDALDQRLLRGETPETSPVLRFSLVLNSTLALTRIFRAPGMPLPPVAELAAQMSGIDPLWAWQETQPNEQGGYPVHEALGHLSTVLLLASEVEPHLERVLGEQLAPLMRSAAGHLLAVLRRAGLSLPDHAFIAEQFRVLEPLRASAFTPQEEDAFLSRCRAISQHLLDQKRGQAAEEIMPQPVPAGEAERTPDEEARPPAVSRPEAAFAPLPPHVDQARRLLSGKRVTLLGGVPSPTHHAALVRDLDLAELDWIGSGEYQHGTHAGAHVTKETAVVILAVRWMGHAHNALREVARERGVPYVMHPGGLNPSSVAYQVLQQVSGQLRNAGAA